METLVLRAMPGNPHDDGYLCATTIVRIEDERGVEAV